MHSEKNTTQQRHIRATSRKKNSKSGKFASFLKKVENLQFWKWQIWEFECGKFASLKTTNLPVLKIYSIFENLSLQIESKKGQICQFFFFLLVRKWEIGKSGNGNFDSIKVSNLRVWKCHSQTCELASFSKKWQIWDFESGKFASSKKPPQKTACLQV